MPLFWTPMGALPVSEVGEVGGVRWGERMAKEDRGETVVDI